MNETFIYTGIACIITSLIGGGLKAFNIEFPVFNSIRRQTFLGIFGLILGGVGGYLECHKNIEPVKPTVKEESPPTPQIIKFNVFVDNREKEGLIIKAINILQEAETDKYGHTELKIKPEDADVDSLYLSVSSKSFRGILDTVIRAKGFPRILRLCTRDFKLDLSKLILNIFLKDHPVKNIFVTSSNMASSAISNAAGYAELVYNNENHPAQFMLKFYNDSLKINYEKIVQANNLPVRIDLPLPRKKPVPPPPKPKEKPKERPKPIVKTFSTNCERIVKKITDATRFKRSVNGHMNDVNVYFDESKYLRQDRTTREYYSVACPAAVYVNNRFCFEIKKPLISGVQRTYDKQGLLGVMRQRAENVFLSMSSEEIKRKLIPCIK